VELDSDLTIQAAGLIVIDPRSFQLLFFIVFFNSAASPKVPLAPGFPDAGS